MSIETRQNELVGLPSGRLRIDSFPMYLLRLGNQKFWIPDHIDFTQDIEDFESMDVSARQTVRMLVAGLVAGMEPATRDVEPFARAAAAEGRLADELYLSQYAFEEAKHVRGLRLWHDAIGLTGELHEYVEDRSDHTAIFAEAQSTTAFALLGDSSPAAQIRASVVYSQIVEGTLALAGCQMWHEILAGTGALPGMTRMLKKIAGDQRRHTAWGTFTCRRHVAAADANWNVVLRCVEELREPAIDLLVARRRALDEESERGLPGADVHELATRVNRALDHRLALIHSALGRSPWEIDGDCSPVELEDRLGEESAG